MRKQALGIITTVTVVMGILALGPVPANATSPALSPINAAAPATVTVVTGHIPAAVPAAKPKPPPQGGGGPAPSPSSTPRVKTGSTKVHHHTSYSSDSKGWESAGGGKMAYADSPSFIYVDTGSGNMYSGSRASSGAPIPAQIQGACQQNNNEVHTNTGDYPYSNNDSNCVWSASISMQNCAMRILNGRDPLDPLANYSTGSKWTKQDYVDHYKTWGEDWDTVTDTYNTAPTTVTYDTPRTPWNNEVVTKLKWRVDWGACEGNSDPILNKVSCTTERSDVTQVGPEGRGLPVKIGPNTKDIEPLSKWGTETVDGSLTTDFGKLYRSKGKGLYGYGNNMQSVNAVNTCNSAAEGFGNPAEIPYFGNWTYMWTQNIVQCEYITYPGYGNNVNFRGCGEENKENKDYTVFKWCTQEGLGAQNENFDPAYCDNPPSPGHDDPESPGPVCSPDINQVNGIQNWYKDDNGTLTKLPTNRTGMDSYYSVVEADGRPVLIKIPPFTMGIPGYSVKMGAKSVFATPTVPEVKWVVWYVDPKSTPWATPVSTPPNDPSQPFSGQIGTARKLSVVPSYELPKESDTTSLTWGADQRTLQLNFYRPGNSGKGNFSVSSAFMEQWEIPYSFPTVGGTYKSGIFLDPSTVQYKKVPMTCGTYQQDFRVIGTRNAGG